MDADGTSRSLCAPRPIDCRRKSGRGAEDGVIVGPESVLGESSQYLQFAFAIAIWAARRLELLGGLRFEKLISILVIE